MMPVITAQRSPAPSGDEKFLRRQSVIDAHEPPFLERPSRLTPPLDGRRTYLRHKTIRQHFHESLGHLQPIFPKLRAFDIELPLLGHPHPDKRTFPQRNPPLKPTLPGGI